jgi:hypothetical protein
VRVERAFFSRQRKRPRSAPSLALSRHNETVRSPERTESFSKLQRGRTKNYEGSAGRRDAKASLRRAELFLRALHLFASSEAPVCRLGSHFVALCSTRQALAIVLTITESSPSSSAATLVGGAHEAGACTRARGAGLDLIHRLDGNPARCLPFSFSLSLHPRSRVQVRYQLLDNATQISKQLDKAH